MRGLHKLGWRDTVLTCHEVCGAQAACAWACTAGANDSTGIQGGAEAVGTSDGGAEPCATEWRGMARGKTGARQGQNEVNNQGG